MKVDLETLKNLSIALGINLVDEEDVEMNGKAGYLWDSFNECLEIMNAYNFLCKNLWETEESKMYQSVQNGKYLFEKPSRFQEDYITDNYEEIEIK